MSESPRPSWPARTRQLRIGEIGIDLHYRRVVRPDGDVELPQRMFELLLLLAAEPHVLHTRGDLMQRIWPGVIVEDANLSQSVWVLRKALGEERKGWIRTVSKKGYVFEPPAPVQAIEQAAVVPGDCSEAPPASGLSKAPVPARQAVGDVSTKRARPWWRHGAVATLVLALLATAAALHKPDGPKPLPVAPSVTLVRVADLDVAAQARLPADLLEIWLGWKLSSLPEVTLLTPTHLAADPSAQATNIAVLLFSGQAADDPSRIFLRAQFEKSGVPHRIQVEGAATELAPMVDTVSTRVLRELVPARARETWPALQVDAVTARQYVELMQANRAHDWTRAAAIGKALTARAPGFGLGHLQLAQMLATLGQIPPALDHLATARSLLRPLPADTAAMLDALRLAWSPQHDAAAAAYAKLSARFPAQTAFSVQHAYALARMGRFADSRVVLSGPLWSRPQPLSIRVARLIARAYAELGLGDYARARATAQQADRLAQAAHGWHYERGQTLLILALADAAVAGGSRESTYFEAAALQFERAGDAFSALRARFLGETSKSGVPESVHVDAWLAQARAAGQRQLELSALRSVAFQHYRAGDIAGYRARLAQAVAVATDIGDRWGLASIETDLLNESFLRGDLADVERRLARVHNNDMQGELALWADVFAALLATQRGQYTQALTALAHGERLAVGGSNAPSSSMSATYACTRATVMVTQGQPEAARAQYAHCGSADPYNRLLTGLGMAEIDLVSGDRAAAITGLRKVLTGLPGITIRPAAWGLSLDVAALLTRVGDTDTASRLYAEVLPAVQTAGYRLFEAYALTGMAEVAMARGNPGAARTQAEAARALAAPDNWSLMQRLQMLDIALARSDGKLVQATHMLVAHDREAHRRGDVLAQVRAHNWMSAQTVGAVCTSEEQAALMARSGLRGATQDWLMPDRPTHERSPALELQH